MFRLTKVSIVALAAVLALVSGCKKPAKNITPIPGLGSVSTTNITTSTAPGDTGIQSARPPFYQQPRQNTGVGNPYPTGGDPTGTNLGNNGPGVVATPTVPMTPDQIPTGSRTEGIRDTETLKSDTVYFDYDKSAIRSSEKSKVAAVADYMKANPNQNLVVEGHCDERGTDEYNRALGERRALSIRESLIGMGTPADRITTTSWGKDRPAELGHDEAAWSRNRRGEFTLIKGGASLQ